MELGTKSPDERAERALSMRKKEGKHRGLIAPVPAEKHRVSLTGPDWIR